MKLAQTLVAAAAAASVSLDAVGYVAERTGELTKTRAGRAVRADA